MGKLTIELIFIMASVVGIVFYAHINEATTFTEINAAIESDFRSIAGTLNWLVVLLLIQPIIFVLVKLISNFLEKREEQKRLNNK